MVPRPNPEKNVRMATAKATLETMNISKTILQFLSVKEERTPTYHLAKNDEKELLKFSHNRKLRNSA